MRLVEESADASAGGFCQYMSAEEETHVSERRRRPVALEA